MMKSGEIVIVVDSVETALRFYTEKLPFDIIDLQFSKEDTSILASAYLRKGKCFIRFRRPIVEELAEFSFIKRCQSRCVELSIETKNDIEKLISRCEKKDVKIASPLVTVNGFETFSVRDPFGIKIRFMQETTQIQEKPQPEIVGLHINSTDITRFKEEDETVLDAAVTHLKNFGISRRAAKKYAKIVFKSLAK